jgi:hypothetical protein
MAAIRDCLKVVRLSDVLRRDATMKAMANKAVHLVTHQEIQNALTDVEVKCGPEVSNLFRSIVKAFDSLVSWLDVETELVRDVNGHMTLTISFPPDGD